MLLGSAMADHRRTLPMPGSPPEEKGPTKRPPPGGAPGTGNTERKSLPPLPVRNAPTRRTPAGTAGSSSDHRRSRPPGRRTPAATQISAGNDLPANASGWMKQGRLLSGAIEHAIADGHASRRLQACIERAFVAWQLGQHTDRDISRVAHLVRRAHEAIRETQKKSLERAYVDCAHILHGGLPTIVRRRVPLEAVIPLMRELREIVSGQTAIVEGTMRLLAWDELAREMSTEAIRVAWEEEPPVSSDR
jgi:hypothetical protein